MKRRPGEITTGRGFGFRASLSRKHSLVLPGQTRCSNICPRLLSENVFRLLECPFETPGCSFRGTVQTSKPHGGLGVKYLGPFKANSFQLNWIMLTDVVTLKRWTFAVVSGITDDSSVAWFLNVISSEFCGYFSCWTYQIRKIFEYVFIHVLCRVYICKIYIFIDDSCIYIYTHIFMLLTWLAAPVHVQRITEKGAKIWSDKKLQANQTNQEWKLIKQKHSSTWAMSCARCRTKDNNRFQLIQLLTDVNFQVIL